MAQKRKTKRAKKPPVPKPHVPADRLHKAAMDLVRFHERKSKKAGAVGPTDTKQALLLKTQFLDAANAFKASKDKASKDNGNGPPLGVCRK